MRCRDVFFCSTVPSRRVAISARKHDARYAQRAHVERSNRAPAVPRVARPKAGRIAGAGPLTVGSQRKREAPLRARRWKSQAPWQPAWNLGRYPGPVLCSPTPLSPSRHPQRRPQCRRSPSHAPPFPSPFDQPPARLPPPANRPPNLTDPASGHVRVETLLTV